MISKIILSIFTLYVAVSLAIYTGLNELTMIASLLAIIITYEAFNDIKQGLTNKNKKL